MKQELIFIWVNDCRCLKKVGFNFSPKYNVCFDSVTNLLSIQHTNDVNIFEERNVLNLSAIIGDNGSGKTTLLEFLTSLNCNPLSNTNDGNYLSYIKGKNQKEMFVAVYLIDGKVRIINKTEHIIYFGNEKIAPITNYDFNHENLFNKTTHVYFTNSEYATDSNMYQNDIDHISIHNRALNSVAQNFYNYTVMYGAHHPKDEHSEFDNFQRFLVNNKTIKDFQQILDVMFLYRIQQKNRSREYLGRLSSSVNVSFLSVLSFIDKYITQNAGSKSVGLFRLKMCSFNNIIKAAALRKYNVLNTLIINLAFELHFLYNFVCYSDEVETIFDRCIYFIYEKLDDAVAKSYYKNAVIEIKSFYEITNNIKSNAVPKPDLGYREWSEILISKLGKFFSNWQKNKCVSFIAKYISIDGLELSSGERALLNFSSRIEMLDYLFKLEGRNMYKPRENILFLFDEIDLYVHPNAQKKLISSLLKQINSLFQTHNVQVIISSHSPIVLSDIPSENTSYLIKNNIENTIVCDGRNRQQTFAANIPSLYRNSFFIEGGIGIGDHALNLINNIALRLNNNDLTKEQLIYYRQIIALIGEPILKRKLEEMLSLRSEPNSQLQYDKKSFIVKDERYEYLSFLRKQRTLIDAEIKRLESENND